MKTYYKKGVVVRGVIALIALCLLFGWAISSTKDTAKISGIKSYTNTTYGYSFNYPSSWKLVESKDLKLVTLSSNKMSTSTVSGSSTPDFVLNIIATSTADFGKQNTKYGSIIFDKTKKAFVDTQSTPARCLPSDNNLGVSIHATTSLPVFHYGGSIMSTPAHSESAIITNKDYMILLNDQAYEYNSGDPIVYSSFKLSNGLVAKVSDCSLLENVRIERLNTK